MGDFNTPRIFQHIFLYEIYCKNCCNEYINVYKWCKPCLINDLKTKNASGNEKINNFIQEMQLEIDSYDDIIFEWIPYNQFSGIKEIGRGGFATVYSAIWKNGPLTYMFGTNKYIEKYSPNFNVALKCLHNSQNITDEFLDEV